MDLPDGLMVSPRPYRDRWPEGRDIARKTAWKGAPDLLQRLLVGCPAGQLANAGPDVFCLVFGSQRHFVKPRLNGAGRVFFFFLKIAA